MSDNGEEECEVPDYQYEPIEKHQEGEKSDEKKATMTMTTRNTFHLHIYDYLAHHLEWGLLSIAVGLPVLVWGPVLTGSH